MNFNSSANNKQWFSPVHTLKKQNKTKNLSLLECGRDYFSANPTLSANLLVCQFNYRY